jgi:peptidoglycan/xylan/chitin deacetylase (PgdA/CDA1 family)
VKVIENAKMNTSRARELAKKVTVKSGTLRFAGALARSAAVILMYHSVQNQPECFANSIGTGIIHAASVFERQMELVARRFHPVGLEDVLCCLKGAKELPRRAVAVTFDDGFADNYGIAAPILAKYGIQAVFYLTAGLVGTPSPPWYCRLRFAFSTTRKKEWRDSATGQVYVLDGKRNRENALLSAFERGAPLTGVEQEEVIAGIELDLDSRLSAVTNGFPFMMNWDQAKKLVEQGHIVGSHTLTHPNLAHVREETNLQRELAESKHKIEEAIGSPVEHFSYPHPALNPQWNEKTQAMSVSAGYRSAVTTTPGPVYANSDPMHLTRIGAPRAEHQFLWNLEWTFLGRRV